MGLYHAEEEREKEKPICRLRLRVREKFAEGIAEVLREELDDRQEKDILTSVNCDPLLHQETSKTLKLFWNNFWSLAIIIKSWYGSEIGPHRYEIISVLIVIIIKHWYLLIYLLNIF